MNMRTFLTLAAGASALMAAVVATPAFADTAQPRWELGLGAGAMSFPPWPGSSHRN